jgi:alpha-galactosidase
MRTVRVSLINDREFGTLTPLKSNPFRATTMICKTFNASSPPFVILACVCAVVLIELRAGAAFEETPAVTAAELRQRHAWTKQQLETSSPPLPFSFTYGSQSSSEFLTQWRSTQNHRRLNQARTELTRTWTDDSTGLEVRCVAVEYNDFPVVEWTVYFKNIGSRSTPILDSVLGLDTRFDRTTRSEFVLHGLKGDSCTADSYEPFAIKLAPGQTKQFSPPGHSGKSCDGPDGWPYYNLQMPGGGVIVAVGWPGQWASSFAREGERRLHITAGQQRTHLFLEPGEEIRTPLIALLFWKGEDVQRAQNLWRRWYLAHNLPRIQGQPQPPVTQIQVDGSPENIASVKAYLDAGIKPDICWRDAGGGYTWYPSTNGPYKGNDVWLNTGTWDVDPAKYPQGFKPFSDWVHAKGIQFLLWFEPERVGDPNSWLGRSHPEWLLPGSSHGSILNLGDAAAREWLIDHVDGLIKSQGLDWYREDMNGAGPLPTWRKHDAADRQGFTENLYVQGHLAFWDELRRRNPGLHIDSCASGGRRNDLETMRRAVPLLRSDFQFPDMAAVVEGNQGHTYGLSSWLPYQGTGCYLDNLYALRSFYLPAFGTVGFSPEKAAIHRQAYAECVRIAPLMLADYHPLTPYNLQTDRWIAWQFNRPERGEGAIQAFRRAQCAEPRITLRLNGLTASARYEITNLDEVGTIILTGSELMKAGLPVEIKEQPGAAILLYHALK